MAPAWRSSRSRRSLRTAFWLLTLLIPPTFAAYRPSFLRNLPCRAPTNHASYESLDDEPFRLTAIPAIRQADTDAKFSLGPVLSNQDVSLSDGTASESLFFIFTPEEGKSINDYDFTFQTTNEKCLIHEDFTIGATQNTNGAYNITAAIDFTRWVGQTGITIVATDKNSNTTTTSETVDCTVIGMTFYREDENGNQIIIGGPNNPLKITTEEIILNPNLDLNVFIQYPDGTDSSESLNNRFPMSGIKITPSGVNQEITHDSSKCADTGNNFNGSTVLLDDGCAYGFSENEVDNIYVGPKFGIEFNKDRRGTFDFRFDWPGLMAGSGLQSEGYETSIDVEITGETSGVPTPGVRIITPDSPFSELGGDTFTCILDNVPSNLTLLQEWEYQFGITFADGSIGQCTFNNVSLTDDGKIAVNFTLPPGTGENLDWNMKVKHPSGQIIVCDDLTVPGYKFDLTLITEVQLGSITPGNGSISGGEEITLTGKFPNFDPSNDSILFDGTAISTSSIISFTEETIKFTLPPKSGDGPFNVSVSVTIDGKTSNSLEFVYEGGVKIDSILPGAGPEEGGTEVVLIGQFDGYDVTNSGVYFGDIQINESLILSTNETHIVFTSPPRSIFGNESQYLYYVNVKIKDEVSNSLPFGYQVPISIDSLQPPFGPEPGGTEVELSGSFGGFTFENGAIYLGGVKINASNFISVVNTSIKFITPPKSQIGESPTQEVWVDLFGIESNKVPFTYHGDGGPLVISPTGGNFEGGLYYVGPCGNTDFRAKLSYGALAQNPTYKWTLVDSATDEDVLAGSGIETDKEIIVLPYSIYPKKNTEYNLTLTVNTEYAPQVQQSYTLVMRDTYGIGVRIVDPRPVSFSNPNITLTIPAVIGSPGCRYKDIEIEHPAITYIWVYRDVSYTFSYLNLTSPKDRLGPTLLGREFQIPQDTMEYGTFPLSLTAFYTNHTQVRGADSSVVTVRPAPLIAKINGGETTQMHSETNDLEMSAGLSYDPDVLTGDGNVGLSYEWSCMYSTDSKFATNTTCGDGLKPSVSAKKFTVGKKSISDVRTDGKETYVQYTLVVTKTSRNATGAAIERISTPVQSVITLPPAAGKKYDQLLDVQITNNQTILLDPANVKYYEDVIITPVAKTTDTTWLFELVEPRSQASLIANPKNLIPYFGFYSIGQRAGRYSLGILSNKLKPNTKYVFKIISFRNGFERNEQTIALKTVEEPTVSISHMPTKNGTVGTVFYASATTNYDGDFKYYFIITDQFGYQYCVDGCQGVSVARFQLASAGSYSLRCEIYDSLGHTMLASTNTSVAISVVPPSPPLTLVQLDNLADSAFLSGDHALYVQYANDVVKTIMDRGNGTAGDNKLDSEIVMNLTRNVGQIVANSVPNPIQSATYVRTAASIARLGPELGITFDIESLYNLVNITQNAIARTPDNAALQQLEDLLQFYDLTPQLLSRIFLEQTPSATSVRQFSSGLTIRQLNGASQNSQKKVIWADMYELMKDQITMILLKGAVCGTKQSIKTGKPSKSEAALSLRYLMARQAEAADGDENETVTEQSTNSTAEEEPALNGKTVSDNLNETEENEALNSSTLTTPEPVENEASEQGGNLGNQTVSGENATSTGALRNVTRNPTQGEIRPSLFQVAKLCNPEQGLELKINEDTKDEVRFKSCPDVFRKSFRTLMFSVVSTPDYVWMSELQRVETRIQGLVSVSVAQHKKGNKLVEDDTRTRNCFEVEMPIITEGKLGELDTKNGSTISGVRFAPKRVFGMSQEEVMGFYIPRVKDTTAKVTSMKVKGGKDSGARARLMTSKTGIFGVTTSKYGDTLRGINWTLFIVLGTVAIILVTVALLALGVHCVTGTREEVRVSPGMVAVDGDYTYVERDNFGRGDGFALLDPQEIAEEPAAGPLPEPAAVVDEIDTYDVQNDATVDR